MHVAQIPFLLDSVVIEEETGSQRGKTARSSESNREADSGLQSGFQTGIPDQRYCSRQLHSQKEIPNQCPVCFQCGMAKEHGRSHRE